MANVITLVSLVKSLTKGEKRYFTTQARGHEVAKDYLRLFNLIEKAVTPKDLKKEFLKAKHTASFETSCKYLFNILTKYLVQLRQDTNPTNQLLNSLMKANLLFEKSLHEQGLYQLHKIRKLAASKELHLIELAACRIELNYYSQHNFHLTTENELIQIQVHMEDLLRLLRKEQQLHNLYELMKYRRFHLGTTRSKQQTADLNDLILSEMNLMNTISANSFNSEKGHLLFQSHYFLTTNDIASALKVFYQLNDLFEKNKTVWNDQPSDYFFMMEGILDSLRSIGKYDDLEIFLNKLRHFKSPTTATHLIVDKITYVYELILLLDVGKFGEAMDAISQHADLFKNIHLFDVTQQAEIYLYTALTYFLNNDLKRAQKYLRPLLLENKLFYNAPIFKTFRLVGLLVHYELHDHQFIFYEARSIKRNMQKEKHTKYWLEKTVLRFLQSDALPKQSKERYAIWEKLEPEFDLLKKDKYEMQLLKIFDFSLWVKSVLTKQPLAQLLKAKYQG